MFLLMIAQWASCGPVDFETVDFLSVIYVLNDSAAALDILRGNQILIP